MLNRIATLISIHLLTALFALGQFQKFDLKILARTGDIVDGRTLHLHSSPRLDNRGCVVFRDYFAGGIVFLDTGNGVRATTMLLHTGGVDPIAVNDVGTVAFWANPQSGPAGIFTQYEKVAAGGDVIQGLALSHLLQVPPAINNSGMVIFHAVYSGGHYGVFSATQPIIKRGDVIGGRLIGGAAATSIGLNEFGTIAALAASVPVDMAPARGQAYKMGIFTQHAPVISVDEAIQGHVLFGFGGGPVINNAGVIAFPGIVDCGTAGGCQRVIATRDRIIAKEGDMLGGVLVVDFPGLVINNPGAIAFVAGTSFGRLELVYSTQLGVIAKPGDSIGGKVFSRVEGFIDINDVGQVAFCARFEDNTEGIVLATPITSPNLFPQ